MTRALFTRGAVALMGGLALFLADYPVSQLWLALVAFVPLLWLVLGAGSRREAALYGVFWGLGRTVPLAVMLSSFGLPLPARFAVEGYLLGLDGLFALVAFELRKGPTWPVIVAMTFATIEYADSRLPMWGTARSVARLFSPYPNVCGLVRLGGASAIAFALVLIQALFVQGIRRRKRGSIFVGALVLIAAGALSIARPLGTSRTLRVAAVGRGRRNGGEDLESFVAEAASRHARVIVFPEVAFRMARGARAAFEAHW